MTMDAARFRALREAFSRAALRSEGQRPLIDAGIELCTELAALTNENQRLATLYEDSRHSWYEAHKERSRLDRENASLRRALTEIVNRGDGEARLIAKAALDAPREGAETG